MGLCVCVSAVAFRVRLVVRMYEVSLWRVSMPLRNVAQLQSQTHTHTHRITEHSFSALCGKFDARVFAHARVYGSRVRMCRNWRASTTTRKRLILPRTVGKSIFLPSVRRKRTQTHTHTCTPTQTHTHKYERMLHNNRRSFFFCSSQNQLLLHIDRLEWLGIIV